MTVDKAGWYIVRCNGFSNTNGLAKLFVNSPYVEGKTASTTLNPLKADGPKDLLEAGKEFYNDKYENEVMIHLTKDEIDNHYGGYLQIGIKVEATITPLPLANGLPSTISACSMLANHLKLQILFLMKTTQT